MAPFIAQTPTKKRPYLFVIRNSTEEWEKLDSFFITSKKYIQTLVKMNLEIVGSFRVTFLWPINLKVEAR